MGRSFELEISRNRILAFLLLPGLAVFVLLLLLNGTTFNFAHIHSYSVSFTGMDAIAFSAVFALLAAATAFLTKGAKSVRIGILPNLPPARIAVAVVLAVVLLFLIQLPMIKISNQ